MNADPNLVQLFEEDPTLEPSEYYRKVVTSFPVNSNQVKNKLTRLRQKQQKSNE